MPFNKVYGDRVVIFVQEISTSARFLVRYIYIYVLVHNLAMKLRIFRICVRQRELDNPKYFFLFYELVSIQTKLIIT